MKHIFLIILIFFSFSASAKDDALRLIKTRGYINCGTDLSAKTYAYKDKDGFWQGIDVNTCKILALAILGKDTAFNMVDVKTKNQSQALIQNKADVIIGGTSNTASMEASSQLSPASILYYDNLVFLTKTKQGATSMEDYRGSNVCVVKDSLNMFNAQIYNDKYALNFNFLRFPTRQHAKETFLLGRCDVFIDSQIYLNSIKNEKTTLIEETIGIIPTSIFVLKQNQSLRIAVKWIINALILAEQQGINQSNISIVTNAKDKPTQNLLGTNPAVWQKLGLNPNWVKEAIKKFGNYGELLNSTINKPFNIKRLKNNLIQNNGLIQGEIFL